MKEQELTKFEFLVKCNDNIIVQRFFNVMNFNESSVNSVELLNYFNNLYHYLHNDLKMKTLVYMIDNQYEINENPELLDTSKTEDDETFHIVLKIKNKTIIHRTLNAKLFPPKVRYTVDLRPVLKTLLTEMTELLSSENLTFELNEYNLA